MAFLDAAKSLKAAAVTDTTVHNLTVTRLDVGHDHGPVSCGWEAPPGCRGRHMAGGASSCSAARHCEAEPLCTDRKGVERQCQTSSCRARSAGCSQAGLCASRSGGDASGSGAWLVVAVAPSSMASTAWMGLKPASHGSHQWCSGPDLRSIARDRAGSRGIARDRTGSC